MATDTRPFDPAKEPYYFSFGRHEDDSEVKIIGHEKGNTWQHTTEGLRAGHERAIRFGGGGEKGGDAWLFSRSFALRANHDYEAAIVSKFVPADRGHRPEDTGREIRGIPRLRLRIGTEQQPRAQTQTLIDWGVTSTEYQPVKVAFRVPKDGTYYFSLQGANDAPGGFVVVSDNGVATLGQLRGL